jgi:2-C-methyl-D-erythritol 2,4-cyclodiphosphate synthase
MNRVGFGYDVHRLAEGRRLVLGGVEIPHDTGLLGHSDADVLAHAIIDAVLGAAALGDIGRHFPDASEEYSGIDSMLLLKRAAALLSEAGYEVANIDSTICAQKPKLAGHIEDMRKNVAAALDIGAGQVSVKATTTEKLGFVGNEEGISAYCVCGIVPRRQAPPDAKFAPGH